MSAIKLNTVCPCHDFVKSSAFHCESCPHFNGYCLDSQDETVVDCKYSKIPTFESPFKVGDKVWYLDMGQFPTNEKVRKIEWRGSFYVYYCGRKQTPYEAFATKEECEYKLAENMVSKAFSTLKNAVKLVGEDKFKNLLSKEDVKLLN